MAAVPPGAARPDRRRAAPRTTRLVTATAALATAALLVGGCSGGSGSSRSGTPGAGPAAAAGSSGTSSASASSAPGGSASSGASSTAATPGTGAASAAGVTKAVYVSLGDSYTAGPGIPDHVGTPPGCNRSSRAYPALVAQSLGLAAAEVRMVGCIGATTDDMSGSQQTFNGGPNPPQLDSLTRDTTLVTLGIGGNDVDVAGVVISCLTLDTPANLAKNRDPAPCRTRFTSGGDEIGQRIAATATSVADTLARIHTRSPHARIYVVGYPELIPDGGTSCTHILDLTPTDLGFLYNQEVRLNTMLRAQARAGGAVFVDTFTPSEGRDACADPSTRWVEPLIPATTGSTLHPNVAGEQGMADAVVRAVRAAGWTAPGPS